MKYNKKAELMFAIETLSGSIGNITIHMGLFSLIDVEALYLFNAPEGTRIIRFSHVSNSNAFSQFPLPVAMFEILSTSNFSDYHEIEMTTDIFKDLKILDLDDLPLYLSNRNSPDFNNLFKDGEKE